MPECKKCGSHFPNTLLIDGKVRTFYTRKFCLDCSPFGKHNTRRLDYTAVKKSGGRNWTVKICCICQRELLTRGSNKCPSCQTNYRRYTVKAKAIQYKGGKCCLCGFDDPVALSFHHRDPTTKRFNITTAGSRGWESVKAELDKCDLLCLNCHAKIESLKSIEDSPVRRYWEAEQSRKMAL